MELETDDETKEELEDKLPRGLAEPGDDDYVSPSQGGCWFCNRGDTEGFRWSFSIGFDTFFHVECLEALDVSSVKAWESSNV